MSVIPPDLRYTPEHEWARREGDQVTVGITDFAQSRLGDVVFLDLPAAGATLTAGQPMGEVESTKSVSDVYSPLSGTVASVNAECRENPAAVNQDPYGEGWLVAIAPTDPGEFQGLLSPEQYAGLVARLEGG